MLTIEKRIVVYDSPDTGKTCRHHVLIADVADKQVLLSHANLFLSEHGSASIETSSRYSGVISMFYRFISTEPEFVDLPLADYHVLADNAAIQRWQVSRQVERVKLQKEKPSSATIFEDAKILLVFFNWLGEAGYTTNVLVEMKTWVANFKSDRLLKHVQERAMVGIDAKNIEVLDKERRQKQLKSLITDGEIKSLIGAYRDPVYAAMFKLGLGTAMRPMDLCAFPYLGNGKNKHIMPHSNMRTEGSSAVDYLVTESKGNKSRTIKVNLADLKVLEVGYIRPYYAARAAQYEQRYKKKCPPSILFLNSRGCPVTPDMISARTHAAKARAQVNDPSFRERVTFYDARHWWPTMFLIKFFKDDLLTAKADALYLAAAEVLRNQMGHDDLGTTYKHYVDMARLVTIAHAGHLHELVTEPTEAVGQFIERMDGSGHTVDDRTG